MLFKYVDYNGNVGYCDIKVYHNVVIATEVGYSTAASITNAAELVAMQVCKAKRIKMQDIVWIEHYEGNGITPETYDRVQFEIENNKFYNPKWTRIGNIQEYIKNYRKPIIAKAKKSSTTKKKIKSVPNINPQFLQLPEIMFQTPDLFKSNNSIELKTGEKWIINGESFEKTGHFRCDFENTTGMAWAQWFGGTAYDKLAINLAAKNEVEAIIKRIRTDIFPNYQVFYQYYGAISDIRANEITLMGLGKSGFYTLRLRPSKGDYNIYLSQYVL